MEKREFEVLNNYYYGISKVSIIWLDDMKLLDTQNKIKRIYEIIDNDYNEVWYLVRDYDEKSYILKSKCGSYYSVDIMKAFKTKYDFCQITTDLIKMYDAKSYPIVFKIKSEDFNYYYNQDKNINTAFFNCYYCCCNNTYKSVREYRNKVEYETFKKEEDAIYWCWNFKSTKSDILSSDIRPLDLKERVYNYEFTRGGDKDD